MIELALSIEINESELLAYTSNFDTVFGSGIVYSKYGYDLLKDSFEKKLHYIKTELSSKQGRVLVTDLCYNKEQLLLFTKLLVGSDITLKKIVLPSANRIAENKNQALENTRLHSRWIGGSEEEVEKNFADFKKNLQEIKDAAAELGYEVEEL